MACDDRAGADDGAVPHGYARQKDRAATYPYILSDAHWQRSLQTATPFFKPVGMVSAVDMHCRPEHRPPSDPDGRRVEDNATCVDVHLLAKREVPTVGDMERSLEENPLADSSEKRREFWRTGTALHGVHGGVTRAGLPRGIAQRL